jgi:superfamily II DNA or RNA helicase
VHQVLVRPQPAALRADGAGWSLDLEDGRTVPLRARKAGSEAADLCLTLAPEDLAAEGGPRNLRKARWAGPRPAASPFDVLESLSDAFGFAPADPDAGRAGLRPPQLGGVHAVLGFWTTASAEPATVVMPTGTGKTETMLALFAVARPPRLLVVVPSDALRTQIAAKLETFGVLQELEVVSRQSLRPCVGHLRHGFKEVSDAAFFASLCNVIVTTPSALDASSPEGRKELLNACSHLFVDEAHHIGATTWRRIRDDFEGKPVVQFTATPFREDGRHPGGRMIYAFPLREAQAQGYFSTINFASVLDLGDHDTAIARRAVEQLRADLDAGHDHLIMARVARIGRAADLLPTYRHLAPDLRPVVLHSTQRKTDREAALRAIRSRESRIVVCVNMLGEGFDLPQLKIAAIHDPHKSLGVTLQFVGRFARTAGAGLGDATVVVGRPERDFDPQLRRLFAEDADWNHIIRDLSEGAVAGQQQVSDFEAGFGSLPDEVAMRSLLPRMSTVVYRTSIQDWDPTAALDVFPADRLLTCPIAVNQQQRVAWFVSEIRTEVKWGELRTVEEVS